MMLPRHRGWPVAIVATLAMTVSYIDRQVIAAIALSVRSALGFDAEKFGWLAGAFSASYLVFAPLAGALLDRVGARRGLLAAIGAWSIVSAAHALAPSFGVLVAMRIALGAAEAPSFPGAAQSVHRMLPAKERSAAFGLLFTGSSLGAAVAAPLALAIDARLGWRAAFAITSCIGTIWIPAWLWVTRHSETRKALANVAPRAPSDTPHPVSRWRLLFTPAVFRAVALVFASAPVLMFVFVWLPQFLEVGRHVPRNALARYVWLPPVMADIGMVGAGWITDRAAGSSPQNARAKVALGAGALAASMALAPLVRGASASAMIVGVAAMGAGALYTILTADMMARVDPGHVSTAGGLTAAAQSLSYVVLSPMVGRWVDRFGSFDGPLVLFGVVAPLGALGWSLTHSAARKSVA
jgi:ACS family hexuronate transporter-like MFS transporter